MAFITLSGTLLDPNGDLAVGDQIRFTHKSTTGETIESAVSIITINPAGTYSLPLQYGLVLVEYKDVRTQQFKNLGIATVNATNPATSIPELLNALVPVSSAELIEFQAILADCVTSQTAAENAATTAEAFAYQLTTVDLIASTAIFASDTNIPTSGFTTSGDGGNGSWKQNGTTGQTPSQSPAQLGNALLNDGNGNQWAMLLSNDFEFETFAELQASAIGNVYQKLICRELNNSEYIIQPLSYIAIGGDALLSNGLTAKLQITRDSIDITRMITTKSVEHTTKPILFAHRGISIGSDTIRQFSVSINNGADGTEIDVQMSSDGTPVMYHDDNLNTITTGSGSVSVNTLAQIQAARFNSLSSSIFSNERIPKVADLLDIIKDTGKLCIFEVKGYRTSSDLADYVQLVMDKDVLTNTYFASFNLADVQSMVDYNGNINILHYSVTPTNADYDNIAAVSNTKLKILGGYNPNLTKELVDYGKSVGVLTAVWTVGSAEEARVAKRKGVNMFITDRIFGGLK